MKWSIFFLVFLFVSCGDSNTVVKNRPATIQVNTFDLNFGSILLLQKNSQKISISNIGDATLSLTNVTLSPANGPFSLEGSLPKNIEAGQQQFLEVSYTAKTLGKVKGSLIIVSNDPKRNVVQINLSGEGKEEETDNEDGGVKVDDTIDTTTITIDDTDNDDNDTIKPVEDNDNQPQQDVDPEPVTCNMTQHKQLTNSPLSLLEQDIAWSKDHFEFVYRDIDHIYYNYADKDGNTSYNSSVLISGTTVELSQPQIASSGKGHSAIVWEDETASDDQIVFTLFKNSLASSKTISTGNNGAPQIIWADNMYAVAWIHYGTTVQDIYMVLIDGNGDIKLGPKNITNYSSAEDAVLPIDIAFNGSSFGITYQYSNTSDSISSYQTYFIKVAKASLSSSTGKLIVTPKGGYSSSGATISWSGKVYGIVWDEEPPYSPGGYDSGVRLYFNTFDSDGNAQITSAVEISKELGSGHSGKIAFNGNNFGVAFSRNSDIHFLEVAESGAIGKTLPIANDKTASEWLISITSTDNLTFGVAWIDNRSGGNYQVYFANACAAVGTN